MSVANIGKLQENRFRHQISKAKYLKMSVANIWKLQENIAALCKMAANSPGKRYQMIRICLTGEVETPSSLIRHQASDAKYLDGMSTGRIPDVRLPGGMSAEQNSECDTSGWNGGTLPYPEQLHPDLLMAKDFKASVLHVSELSIALPWIPKNSPQSLIALVIKKLSKHQNLTQFD